MPLPLDFLKQIINVHWGGGVSFVSGADGESASDDLVRYIKFQNTSDPTEARWVGLGSLSFSNAAFCECSSYGYVGADEDGKNGNPVFLLGGQDLADDTTRGVIMASRDGKNWSEVYRLPQGNDDESQVFGLVWDGHQFWGGAGHLVYTAPGFHQDDVLLSSHDGFSWTEAGRAITHSSATIGGGYDHGLLAAKCSDRVLDQFENGVPDGVYGYDKGKDILIRPTTLQTIIYQSGVLGLAANPPSPTVLRNGKSVNVGIPVMAVAYAGGVWVAVGGTDSGQPQSAHSFDDGNTWVVDPTPGDSRKIWTVSGATKTELAT